MSETHSTIFCAFPDCPRRIYAKGLCKRHREQQLRGEPLGYIKTIRPKGTMPRIICDEVYCPNHDLFGPCHVFRGYIDDRPNHGYGVIGFQGKLIMVHRYCWEREVGPIPEGLVIDHQCRNRACCNVDHLRVVTRRVNATENVVGTVWQKNAAKTHCIHGHPLGERLPGTLYRLCKTCDKLRDRNAARKRKDAERRLK
jgi:HNH endonuclease